MSQAHTVEGFVSGLVKQFTARPDTVASEIVRLGAVRRQTLGMVVYLTEEQATWSPKPGAWSVLQILDHIVLFEDLYRDAIQKLIELGKQGRKTEIKYTLADLDVSLPLVPKMAWRMLEMPLDLANNFIPSSVRQVIIRFPIVPATSPKVADPRPGVTLATARENLVESAGKLADLLATPLKDDGRNMKISHPILGINNIVDLLGMTAAHEERHQKQIREILMNPKLPRA